MARVGAPATGRTRSIIGLVLAFAMPALVVGGIPLLQTQLITAAAQREGVPRSAVLLETTGFPALYSQAEAEATFRDGFEEQGAVLDSVTCPAAARMVVGGGFECSFVVQGVTHTAGLVWTSNRGDFDTFIDGVQVQN